MFGNQVLLKGNNKLHVYYSLDFPRILDFIIPLLFSQYDPIYTYLAVRIYFHTMCYNKRSAHYSPLFVDVIIAFIKLLDEKFLFLIFVILLFWFQLFYKGPFEISQSKEIWKLFTLWG